MRTTKTERSRRATGAALLVAFTALLVIAVAHPAAAVPRCGERDCAAFVAAARRDRSEGILDKVGLGSLEDIPWEALPVALGLSAIIGAAGGFVYAGIVGSGTSGERPSARDESADA
ncbi:MAG: hypothetical protein M3198_14700 [Actinomycetota bacterium]|nr:hypothetical protein [Actinomycetota bacterium]